MAEHLTDDLEDDAAAVNRAIARRDWLLANERWLTSDEVAARSRGALVRLNMDQFAYHLRQSGKLLGVLADRKRLHPMFQFQSLGGRIEPTPVMKTLLEILPRDETGWTQALWFFQPTSRLDGKRPADVLIEHPDDVINAARRDFIGDKGI